jgi:hypothetical protein
VAVAEKLSVLRTEEYFEERRARSNVNKALRVLKRAGVGNPPVAGDELPTVDRSERVSSSGVRKSKRR